MHPGSAFILGAVLASLVWAGILVWYADRRKSAEHDAQQFRAHLEKQR